MDDQELKNLRERAAEALRAVSDRMEEIAANEMANHSATQ